MRVSAYRKASILGNADEKYPKNVARIAGLK